VYAWEINDFNGTYGFDPGWDRFNCTGTLTIASTSANAFTVRVASLTYENISGIASNFDATLGHTQLIASAVSISGFATNKFVLDLASFGSSYDGLWKLAQMDSTNIAIVYFPPTPPGIAAGPATLTYNVMFGDTPATQSLSVTNVGGSNLYATNYVTYGTGASGWFTPSPGSLTITATTASNIAASISVAGLSAGSYCATNRVDGNQTNAAFLTSITLNYTNIPQPQSVSATADGNEMVRLTSAESGGRTILAVHRSGSAPTADPTNGTAYSVGDLLGGGKVLAKFTGSSTISNLEHVVTPGGTEYYRFYTINNNWYSPAVQVSATMGGYRTGIGVDTFSYTNLNLLASRSGGFGWSNNSAWSESTANAFTNEAGNLAVASGYPYASGNKVSVRSPAGAGNNRSATRDIPAISAGKIYVSFVANYEFAEIGNEQHYFGMSLMSNGTELAFFGEGANADETVSLDSFGSGTVVSKNVTLSNGFNQAYTIIGAYDFGSRVLKVKAFHNATNVVPVAEPNLSQWDSMVTTSVGRINMLTGLRLTEGTGGGGSGHPGTIRFDEVRFSTNWANLLNQDDSYPYATNFVVNGGSDPTDQQVKDGTFSVVYHIRDAVGIETTNSINPFFVPNFDLFNSNHVQILTNEVFSDSSRLDNGQTFIGTDTTHAAVDVSQVTLGSYSSRWSAANSNGFSTIDSGSFSNGTALTFNVVDDDTAGPVHSGFMTGTQSMNGAYFNYPDAYGNNGFSVTGVVTDASGVFDGTSNRYVVTAPDGTIVASGFFIAGFTNGGAITGGSLSNTVILSKPHNEGVHTMEVVSVDFDLDRPGDSLATTSKFKFAVGPQPDTQMFYLSPTSITYQVMLGNNASNFAFSITNEDWGILHYTIAQTYGSGASGWVTVTPSSGTLRYPKSQDHVGTIASSTFTSSGTYVATNVVDGDQVITGAQYLVVNLVVTNIPDPQSLSATPDGSELVRLTAAEAAGRQVLVFHSLEDSGLDFPTNGSSYSVGDVVGNSRVIFKFTGSAALSNFEHVVAAGTTNYYRFYAINNSRYSTGTTAGAVMSAYPGNSQIEQFAYTNGTALHGVSGGSAWSGAWSVSGGNGWTNLGNGGTPNFVPMPFYPTRRANMVRMSDPGNGANRTAARSFAAYTSGKIYVSYLMAYDFSGPSKFAGLSLMSTGTEKAYIGEVGGADRILGLDSFGAGSPANSTFNINPLTSGDVSASTGNVYLIVGAYDFSTRELKTKAFYRTTSVPLTEPGTWDASATVSSGLINSIDGIRLIAGCSAGGATVGNTYFDDIRVARSWTELLDETSPYLTNYVIGATNYVSDAQMTGGTYGVRFEFYSRAGMTNSATVPNIDIFDPVGNQLVTDQVFSAFTYTDNGHLLLASNTTVAAVPASSVVLGVYTSRWSAFDSNGVGVINSTLMSNGTPVTFTVVDDDTTAPVFGTSLGGRAMDFTIGGTNYGSGSGTNGLFTVADADLAQVGAVNPMKFIFNVYDPESSVQRSNGGTVTNLNFDVGAAGPTNIFGTYSNGLSAADTTLSTATSVFYHTVPFTIGGSGSAETGEVSKMISAVTNVISVSVRNMDNDRAGDAESFIDLQAGSLVVVDDDTNGPVAKLLYVGTNYVFGATNDLTVTDGDLFAGGKVSIAYQWYDPSGVFATNSDLTKTNIASANGNVSMNWDLTNAIAQVGSKDVIHSPSEIHGHNGDQYITNVMLNITAIPITNNSLSTWYLTVSAQDMDNDRGTFDPGGSQAGTAVSYDRAITTNQLLSFSVVDDDTEGPTAPANVRMIVGGEWTNANISMQWSTNSVADPSGISGYRIYTNAPADIFVGTNAGIATQFVWVVGNELEGVQTNYLYALDADNDRTNDYMYGVSVTFTTKLDRTPPAMVTNIVATIGGVSDDSTQIRLTWSGLTNAGSRAADGDPLSPWKSYVVYYTSDETLPTTNSPSLCVDNGPPDLGTNTTTQLILSNLLIDTIFKFRMAGLDVAGNYSPISDVVTQRTTGLVLTQSVVSATNGVTIKWNLKPDLPYDVIYQDSPSWANNLTNNWQLLASVTNIFPADTGTAIRVPPQMIGNTMRFYRVSGSGQWQTNRGTRAASRDIYVARPFTLTPGENWVSLFFEPDINTAADILGTNRLPSGLTSVSATKVSWYSASGSAIATNIIWLASSNHWIYGSVGGSGSANDQPLPVHEGFNIEIPSDKGTQRIVLVGRLPTNAVTYNVDSGGPGLANDVYYVRSLGIPRRTTLAESGLKGALTGAPNQSAAPDEIRILQTTNGSGRAAIKARAWLKSDGTFHFYTAGSPSADSYVIEPGDAVIIVRRNFGTTTVTNALHYTPPGRNINP
jgi:hypothetical protein